MVLTFSPSIHLEGKGGKVSVSVSQPGLYNKFQGNQNYI